MFIKTDKNGNACFYGSWLKGNGGIWEIDRSSGSYLILKDIFRDTEKAIHNTELKNYERLM